MHYRSERDHNSNFNRLIQDNLYYSEYNGLYARKVFLRSFRTKRMLPEVRIMIRIAIPNKGRLHDPTVELLKEAGLPVLEGGTRKLFAKTNDPEITILFARASDIPEYVQDGAADVGVTGLDLISETGAQVEMLLDMGFGRASLVLAVPEESHLNTPQSLEGKRIATEFPNITSRYFKNLGVNVEIVKVSGACELTPHVGIADAIVDISSSGTTLATNHLEDDRECLFLLCLPHR